MKAAAALLAAILCLAPQWAAAAAPGYGGEVIDDPLLQAGLKHLYDLDYKDMRRVTSEFVRLHPENAYGELFAAGALWWESATEGKGSSEDPLLADLIERHSERGLDLAKDMTKSPERRRSAEGYFIAGMILGLRGQWFLYEGKIWKAYRTGKKARKNLKKAVKMDPELYDAYLGLGVFDYQVATLPGVLKLGARLLIGGDAELGLGRIKAAIEKGRFASQQAAQFLLTIYLNYENNPQAALKLNGDLMIRFPTSPYYKFIQANLLNALGDHEGSRREARALFASLTEKPGRLRQKAWGTVCGAYGKPCLEDERLETAEKWLDREASSIRKDAPAGWTQTVYLMRGLVRDMLGKRDAAVKDYVKALRLPDFEGMHRIANDCLRKSCGKKDVLRLR